MSKYLDKYRIETARLKEWDYSTPWWYFVTINTRKHISYFGNIETGEMILNDLGRIAEEEWLRTKAIRSNIDLDYFVVMPNHFHGIIILKDYVETCRGKSLQGRSLPQQQNEPLFSRPIKNSLSVIINQFKGSLNVGQTKMGMNHFTGSLVFSTG